MAKKTVTEKLVEYVTLCGYREIDSRSKYRTFSKDSSETKVFIGKKGAFRHGRIASKSRSVLGTSVTHKMIDVILKKKMGAV